MPEREQPEAKPARKWGLLGRRPSEPSDKAAEPSRPHKHPKISVAKSVLLDAAEPWTVARRDEAILGALSAALQDSDSGVINVALLGIAEIEPKVAAASLTSLALKKRIQWWRYAKLDVDHARTCIFAAEQRGHPTPKTDPWRFADNNAYEVADFECTHPDAADLAWLMEAVKDETEADRFGVSRVQAAMRLGKIASARAIPALAEAANAEDEKVQAAALRALGDIGSVLALPIVKKLERLQKPSMRVSLLYANERMKMAGSTINNMMRVLGSDLQRAETQYSLAEVFQKLAQKGGRPAAPQMAPYLTDEDPAARRAVVKALGELGDPQAIFGLAHLAHGRSEDEALRVAAIKALGDIGDKEALNDLLNLLDDDQEAIRAAAVKALGLLRSQRARSILVKAALSARPPLLDPSNEFLLAKAVGKSGDVDGTAAFGLALTDGNSETRKRAVQQLAYVIGKQSVIALIYALEDVDPEVRVAACHALVNQVSYLRMS